MVFPSAWKVAKVTPVFKGNGSRSWVSFNSQKCKPWSASREYTPVLFLIFVNDLPKIPEHSGADI